MRIRRVVIGLAVVACAVALATSASLNRTTTPAVRQPGKIARGFLVFNDYFCAACHVMKAAGPPSYRGPNVCDGDTACTVGVDFNKVHVSSQVAIPVIEHGLPAALPLYVTQMPPFARVLTKRQIQDVASFLAKYSGEYKTCIECVGFKPSGFPTG